MPNGLGGFICQCPPGYSGARCEDSKHDYIVLVIDRWYIFEFSYSKMILACLNRAWIKAVVWERMVVFDAYAHRTILAVDVKHLTHVQVILAWTEACVNQWMAMVVIYAYVCLAIMVHDVKIVRIYDRFFFAFNIWLLLNTDVILFFSTRRSMCTKPLLEWWPMCRQWYRRFYMCLYSTLYRSTMRRW